MSICGNRIQVKRRVQRLIVLGVILMSGISIANGENKVISAGQPAKAERELRKLEREWLDAYLTQDVGAMKRIVADDFMITYNDGSTRDKAETIRRLGLGPKNSNEYHWTEDSKVRVYDDMAIITGRFLYKVRDKDRETVSESRYTDTYIKRNGRWQVVASHLSRIVKK